MRHVLAVALILLASGPFARASAAPLPAPAPSDEVTEGELRTVDPAGTVAVCPLRRTDVVADVSGFVARVTVTQRFENPFDHAIEAVYLFPLAGDGAVDRMTMRIGDRVVRGRVDRRAAARAAYESARAEGKLASLLEQERPNVFTQSVANIPSSAAVEIEISYVQTLVYEDGAYRFVFPMTVGQRYAPAVLGPSGTSAKYPATRAPLARPGHDVSLRVSVDAGVPIAGLASERHAVSVERPTDHSATVRLAAEGELPNRDFVLSYTVAGGAIDDALLAHRDARGGFFTFVVQPPARVAPDDVTAKEIVFAVDTSGSMSGEPMEKAKETIRFALEHLSADDTFNVVTFAGVTDVLFKQPAPATPANRATALRFVEQAEGRGGTEMMDAVRAALAPSDRQDHVRVVCFLTDGYVGNDLQILDEIQKHPNARVFALGIGDAPNRFLLEKMAEEGRGDVAYVGLDGDASAAAQTFFDRVRNPLLTDVAIDWNGLDVTEMYPARLPDVFSAKPVVVTGRYTTPGSATIRLTGRVDGREVVREIPVVLPDAAPANDALATIWARRKVDDLMRQDYLGVMRRAPREGVDEAIAQLGLDFGIATQFTSFVAVDDAPAVGDGAPSRVDVPGAAVEGTVGSGPAGRISLSMVGRSPLSLARLTSAEYGASSVEPSVAGASVDGEPASEAVAVSAVSETVTVTSGSGRIHSRAADGHPAAPSPARLADGAHPAETWRRANGRAGVEIVFAIDTTGSMSGLLDGAKRRIWSIVNEIMRSNCRPDVRIGIVAYRDRGDAYESQILPLTSDLDLVYRTLTELRADGGGDTPEDVRRGLADALGAMGWSPASNGLAQVLFLVGDAPPHAYGDLPSTEKSSETAARRGIVVHAMQCGADPETRAEWEKIARGGGGAYFAIPSEIVAAVERTPFDAPLAELGNRLGATYLPYGSTVDQTAANARQAALERDVRRRALRSTAADRAINKAVNVEAYSGDFLQAVENGTLRLEDVAPGDLPEDLRGLAPEALRKEVSKRIARRRHLRAAILDIARLRDEFAAGGKAENSSAGFDASVGDAVKKRLAEKGGCGGAQRP